MTRLSTIPPYLAGKPTYEQDEARTEVVARLRALRAELSLCASRMAPTRESVEREVERAERVLGEVRALAATLGGIDVGAEGC